MLFERYTHVYFNAKTRNITLITLSDMILLLITYTFVIFYFIFFTRFTDKICVKRYNKIRCTFIVRILLYIISDILNKFFKISIFQFPAQFPVQKILSPENKLLPMEVHHFAKPHGVHKAVKSNATRIEVACSRKRADFLPPLAWLTRLASSRISIAMRRVRIPGGG